MATPSFTPKTPFPHSPGYPYAVKRNPPATEQEALSRYQEARSNLDAIHHDMSLVANPDNKAATKIEVVEQVPWRTQRLYQAKATQRHRMLGRIIRENDPDFDNQVFTMHEYGYGRSRDIRTDKRYSVKEKYLGYVVPYAGGSNPPENPGARNTYVVDSPSPSGEKRFDPRNTQPIRPDAMVFGPDGLTWNGGLLRFDRGAIAVGKDIAPVGYDARPIPRDSGLGRFIERTSNAFGANILQTPNDIGRGLDVATRVYDPLRIADIEAQTRTMEAIIKTLSRLGSYAMRPELPPGGGNSKDPGPPPEAPPVYGADRNYNSHPGGLLPVHGRP